MTIWFLEDENRAPKVNVGARQAGVNKIDRIKHPSSRTDGNNRGKAAKFRVACPECPFDGGYPQYVTVTTKLEWSSFYLCY